MQPNCWELMFAAYAETLHLCCVIRWSYEGKGHIYITCLCITVFTVCRIGLQSSPR